MRPEPSLDGVQAKVGRAREQFESLSEEVCAFLGGEACDGFVEFDPETRWRIREAQVSKRPPSMRWGTIVGEIAYHLRSALDQLVWELVRLNEQVPGAHNEFPIAIDPGWYAKRGPGKLKGLAGGDREIIERAQPYHLGNAAPEHPLALLDWMAQVDKHRFVHTTVPRIGGRVLEGLDPEGTDVSFAPFDIGLDEGRSLNQVVGQAGPYVDALLRRFDSRFAAGQAGCVA